MREPDIAAKHSNVGLRPVTESGFFGLRSCIDGAHNNRQETLIQKCGKTGGRSNLTNTHMFLHDTRTKMITVMRVNINTKGRHSNILKPDTYTE